VRKAVKKPASESAARPEILSRDGDGRVVVAEVKDVKGGSLRDLSDQLRQQEKALAVVLGSVDDGRVFVVVNLDPSLEEQGLDAVAVVRALAPIIGGGGGGRPGLAEAGGKDPARLREALEAGRDAVVAALP
jgi:alanyl-tRNA synthetase